MAEKLTILICGNPDCDWVGPLDEVIVWPQGPEHLRCPDCQEAVAFVDDEDLENPVV